MIEFPIVLIFLLSGIALYALLRKESKHYGNLIVRFYNDKRLVLMQPCWVRFNMKGKDMAVVDTATVHTKEDIYVTRVTYALESAPELEVNGPIAGPFWAEANSTITLSPEADAPGILTLS